MYKAVARLFMIALKVIRTLFKSKDDLITENLALRQQLAACKAKKIRPKLSNLDRSFWVALRQAWSSWKDTLIIVKPENGGRLAETSVQKILVREIIKKLETGSTAYRSGDTGPHLANGKADQVGRA